YLSFFLHQHTPLTYISILSLHDALPISNSRWVSSAYFPSILLSNPSKKPLPTAHSTLFFFEITPDTATNLFLSCVLTHNIFILLISSSQRTIYVMELLFSKIYSFSSAGFAFSKFAFVWLIAYFAFVAKRMYPSTFRFPA